MAELPELGYTSIREALAKKFHMAEPLLAALNRNANFDRAGTRITVVNVSRDPGFPHAAKWPTIRRRQECPIVVGLR